MECLVNFWYNIFEIFKKKLRPWSSWTANSDKKYMELNRAFPIRQSCIKFP